MIKTNRQQKLQTVMHLVMLFSLSLSIVMPVLDATSAYASGIPVDAVRLARPVIQLTTPSSLLDPIDVEAATHRLQEKVPGNAKSEATVVESQALNHSLLPDWAKSLTTLERTTLDANLSSATGEMQLSGDTGNVELTPSWFAAALVEPLAAPLAQTTGSCPPNVTLSTLLSIPPGLVSLGNVAGDIYTATFTNNSTQPITDVNFYISPNVGFYFLGGSASLQNISGTLPITQPLANTSPATPFEVIVSEPAPTSTVNAGATITLTFRLATNGVAQSGQPLKIDVLSGIGAGVVCDSEIQNIPTGRGNLAIVKSPELQSAAVGDIVTWTLTARNTGLGNIYDAVVTDSVSSGISLLSISPPLSTLSAILAPNQSTLFTITGRVDSCTNLNNSGLGAWTIGNVDGTATDIFTNPVKDQASVLYDFADPNITVQMAPVNANYCGALDTNRVVTITNSGGPVRNFRLNSSTSGNLTITNLDNTNWSSSAGVYSYLPNSGLIARNQVVTFTLRVQSPNICSPTIGEIILAPVYADTCTLITSSDPAAVIPVSSPNSPSIDLVKTASSTSILPGQTVFYTLTARGVNPSGIMPSIRITDAMPTGLSNIQYSTSLTPALTSSGNNLDVNMPLPAGNYSVQVYVRGTAPSNVCTGGVYRNVARASYAGCPFCNTADADAKVLYITNPIGSGGGSSFTMNESNVELCGIAPTTKSATLSITDGITWTGTIFEDDLDTGGGPGPLYASNVIVFVDGIDRSADVTATLNPLSVPHLRILFDGIGVYSATAAISITYNVTASASSTPGEGYYFSRFTLGGLPNGSCGTTGTSLNHILLERAVLGNLTVAPSIVNACRVNNIRIRVDGQALSTTLSNNIAVSFTANAGDVFTPTQFALSGGFGSVPTSTVAVTKTGNIVTFTFPAAFDLDSAGIIDFPLFRHCGEIRPLTATLSYLDRCEAPGTDSNIAAQQTQESNLILLSPAITYTINSTQVAWNFDVRNVGAIAAENALVTSTLPFGHSVFTYSVANVPAALANAITFSTGTVGANQVITWQIPALDSGQRIQFVVTDTVASCTNSGDQVRINLYESCNRVNSTCGGSQSATLGFIPGVTTLLSSNTQDGVLPMCETGKVVLTVKNASPKSEEYRYVITDVIRSASYQFGSATLDLVDEFGVTVLSGLPFTPTSIITYATIPVSQTLTWDVNAITNTYSLQVKNALLRAGPNTSLVVRFGVTTNCASVNVTVASSVSAENVCGTVQKLQEQAKSLVVGFPDLKINKTVRNATLDNAFSSSSKAAVGDTVVWQMEVRNDGKQRALNLFVRDMAPPWFQVTATNIPTSSQISNSSGITLNWHEAGGTILTPTLSSFYLITGTVTANACANPSPNRGLTYYGCSVGDICFPSFVTATASVDFKPVLSIAAPNVTLNQCGPGPIRLNFANNGARAQNVVVSYTLPAGFAYSGLVTATSVPTPIAQPALGATGTVTWLYSIIETGWLTNTLLFTVSNATGVCPVNASGTADIRYEDSCGIAYDDVSPDTNSLTVVKPQFTGSFAGGAPQTPLTRVVTIGQVVSWNVGISNTGAGNANNVVITDTLAPGYTTPSASAPAGYTPTVAGNNITWTTAVMTSATSFNGLITATVSPLPSSLGVTLTASSKCADGGCLQTLTYRKYATALQYFTKTNVITQATIGDIVTYTVNSFLFGNYAYTSTILSDSLPAGLGYVDSSLTVVQNADATGGPATTTISTTPTAAPAANATGNIRWDLGSLNGQILITGVITAVVRNIATNFEGVVLTNQANLTYQDEGQPYAFNSQSTVNVIEPLLHIGKRAVTAQQCSATIYEENFNSGSAGSWSALGSWSVTNHFYRNTSNASNRRTFAANGVGSDLSYSFMMRTTDSSGSMGGYVRQAGSGTTDSGYLFRWNNNGMQLQMRSASITTLASNTLPYETNHWYHVEMRATGSLIQVFVDGVLQLSAQDSTYNSGNVGLFTSSLDQADFDDLLVSKLDSASCLVAANDLITYTLTISNQGAAAGNNLIISDVLPAGLSLVTYTASSNRAPITITLAPLANATDTLLWNISRLDPVTPFASNNHSAITLTVVARVSPTIAAAITLTNQALVSYDSQLGSGPVAIQRDYSGGSHSVAVQTVPPIDIFKYSTPLTATIGQTVVYTILVPGTPISAALSGISVTDIIAANLGVTPTVSVSGTNAITPNVASYLGNGAFVTVTFERIEANTQATIVITSVVTDTLINQDGVQIPNSANLNWNNGAGTPQTPIPSNVVTTTVIEPNLAISKSASAVGVAVKAGDTVTYTVLVNHTPASTANAYNVVISDLIPGFFTYKPGSLQVSPTPNASVATDQNITVTFDTFTLNTGGLISPTLIITYAVTVDAAAEPSTPLTNTVTTAYSSMPGANPYERTGSGGVNDYYTSTQSVVRTGDLIIEKILLEDRNYTIGEAVTYTILITLPTGSTRLDPVITDTIPAGMRYEPSSSFLSLVTTPTFALPGYAVNLNPAVGGSGALSSTATLAFNDNLSNTTGAPATIAWTFRLIVADVTNANHDEVKPNSAQVGYVNANDLPQILGTNPVSITLTEPTLIIEKSVDPSNARPGDAVFYEIRLYHATTSTVAAYNVLIQDRIASTLNYIAGTWELGNTPQAVANTAIYTTATPNLLALFPVISPTFTITDPLIIRYQAVVRPEVPFGTLITNVVASTWTSLPNNPYGDRRNGNGGVDDYHQTSQADLTIADVTMDKTGPISITAGSIITYQITIRNIGPLTATSSTIVDNMPFQVTTLAATYSIPTVSNGSCNIVPSAIGDQVSCAMGAIPVGVTATVIITGKVDPNTPPGADLINSADVALTSPDGNQLNNHDEVDTEVYGLADLAVDKLGPLTATAGSQVTYTLVLTNNGPSTSQAVDVKDLLPSGVTFDNGTSTQGLCVNAICQLGDVQPSQVITMVVTGTVGNNTTGILTNTAQGFAATPDSNLANNAASVTTTVGALTQLWIDKIDLSDPVYAGSSYFYEIVVTNTGPSAANNVVITDRLPAQVTFQGASPGCSQAGGVFTCTVGTLLPGESQDFLLNVLLNSGVTSGTLGSNTVAVTTTTPLAAGSRITDSELTTYLQPVGSPTDLAITKSSQATSAVAGSEKVTYTLVISNNGPAPASAVQVVDAFPPVFNLLSATTSKPITQAACDNGVVCTISSLSAGERVTITLVFSVPATTAAAVYTNTATVSSPAPETNQSNNSASAPVTITTQATLSLAKFASPNPVIPGSALQYQIVVTNSGPSDAQNVVISDTLPSGFVRTLILASQGGCAALPCTLGKIPAGGNATVTVIGTAAASATAASLVNSAQVTSTTPSVGASTSVSPTISQSADLVLIKRATATAAPGETILYTLTVQNLGPSDAATVTLSDTLPAGVTFLAASSGCTENNSLLICNAGTLAAGATRIYTITAVVSNTVAAGVSLENSARVTSAAVDPNTLNNQATADTNVIANADLTIAKRQLTANPVAAGDWVTYSITITNNGPGLARSVDVKDQLPAGLSLVSSLASDGGICGGAVCQFGTLPIHATRTVTVVARVDAGTTAGDVINQAAVFSTDEVNPANDTATVTTTITTSALLTLDKVALVNPVNAGEVIFYQLTVRNQGPSDAQSVILSDTLPVNTTFAGADVRCANNAGLVTCALGTLPAGSEATVLIQARVSISASNGLTVTNVATVTSPTASAPITDSAMVSIQQPGGGLVDLQVEKSGAASVSAGEPVTYTIVVSNAGPAIAQNVQLADGLPDGVRFVSALASKGSCNGAVNCTLGAIAVGERVTVSLVGWVDADVISGTILVNSAQVSSSNPDSNPLDNLDSVSSTVSALALVTLRKDAIPTAVQPGDRVFYRIVISNSGPATARSLVVSDALPAGLSNLLISSSQGGCTSFPCTVGALQPGAAATIQIVASVAADVSGVLTNSATLTTTTDLASGSIVSDSALVSVGAVADLWLTKRDLADPVLAGESASYTLTVFNRGPSPAQNVRVTDTLPYGTSLLAASSDCSLAGNLLICSTPALAANASLNYTVTLLVSSSLPIGYSLVNRAEVGSSTPDPNLADNVAVEDTEVMATAALSMSKSSAPNPVIAGELLTYTIVVTNHGPADATDVRVIDALPAQVSFVSAQTSNGGICNSSVFCLLGTLKRDEMVTITVVVRVAATLRQGDWFANSAQAFSDQLEPPVPISATNVTTVSESVDLSVKKQDFPDPAGSGATLRYQLLVSNAGPSQAFNVLVTDTLPTAVTFLQATLGFNCNEGPTGMIVCSLPVLGAGESRLIDLLVHVADNLADGTVITNSATVSSNSNESDNFNNFDQITTTVRSGTDLMIVKSGPDLIEAGTSLEYNLVVQNLGHSSALATLVTDTLPTHLIASTALVSSSVGTCSITAGVMGCQLGDLVFGVTDTVWITITARVNPTAPIGTMINNRAEASSGTFDFNLNNNSSVHNTLVTGRSDLAIAKSATFSATAGLDTITYTVVISNLGPSQAIDVMFNDPLPVGLSVAGVVSTTKGNCDNLVQCSIGVLNVGESVTVTIFARVDANVDDGTIIPNNASVTGAVFDDNPLNDSAQATTTIDSLAMLQIRKINLFDPVTPGGMLFYRVTVSNTGPSTAHNLIVSDTLPANVIFQAAGADCLHDGAASGGLIRCTVEQLPPGERYEFLVTAIAPIDVVSGTVLSNQADAVSDNGALVSDAVTTTVRQSFAPPADLEVRKSGDAVAIAGGEITYTIVVTNHGPAIATGVDLKEQLPAGVTASSITSSQGICLAGGLCQFGNIGVSNTVTITVRATLDPALAQGSVLTNTVRAFADNADRNELNNLASVTTTVNTLADLALLKSALVDPVQAGEVLGWQIVVTNSGPSLARTVVISDLLPAGVQFVGASPECNQSAGLVTCLPGDIQPGAGRSLLIQARVSDLLADGTLITNSASLTSTTADPVSNNNRFTTTTTVSQTALGPVDLSLSKTAAPDSVVAGELLTYTLVVTNSGPADAQNVVVNDALPAGVLPVASFASQGLCSVNGVCTLGNLAVDATAMMTIVVRVKSGEQSTVTNSATVAASNPEQTPGDNSASVATTVTNSADLHIAKSGPITMVAGEIVNYQITISNTGSSDAQNVVVSDTVPQNTTFLGTSPECSEVSGIVSCAIDTLKAGESRSYFVQVRINNTIADPTIITNTASITSTTSDPNPVDNSSTITGTATQSALNPTDLTISKSATPESVVAGELLTYTLVVTNIGPAPATNVRVVDLLPVGTTLLDVSSSQGVCNSGVSCEMGDLAVGASATITIVAKVASNQVLSLTNSATVAASNPDANPTNNSASVTTSVTSSANLHITKSGPAVVTAGETVRYRIAVSNTGPSDALGVLISDTLPSELTIVTAPGCNVAGNVLACNLSTLAVGETQSYLIDAQIKADALGVITNSATISSETPSTLATSTTSATVVTSADLQLLKAASASANAGETIQYTLTVVNFGPSDAQGVIITDSLPIGVGFESSSSGCGELSGIVTCTMGVLASGEATVYTLTVRVASDVEPGSSLENGAVVRSDTTDPNPFNNQATADTSILGRVDLLLDKSGPSSVIAGEQVTYTIVVTNVGPSNAQVVDMKDSLPGQIVLASTTVERSGAGVTACVAALCQVGDMAVGEVVTMTVVGTVNPGFSGTLTNTATVFSDSPISNTATTSDSVVSQVSALADLHIAKSGPISMVAGEVVNYQITISNSGSSDAQNVVISDTVPANTNFLATSPECGEAGGIVSCVIVTLKAGESRSYFVQVRIDNTIADPTVITNTASITSTTSDPNPLDNSSTITGTATQSALNPTDLTISKSATPESVVAGELLTYTLILTNIGPAPATNVRVVDLLPVGTTLADVSSSQGTCNGGVSCEMGDLAVGASATITVVVKVNSGQVLLLTNSATVAASNPDPNMANNSASVTTTVTSSADLHIIKSGPATMLAGEVVLYQIVVSSSGSSDAQNVIVSDTIPLDTIFVSASPACGETSGVVSCTVGTLKAGESRSYFVQVRIDIGIAELTIITNTATIGSSTADPNPLDNSSTITGTATQSALNPTDLSLSKTASPDPVVAGELLTYTLVVTNHGPAIASNVIVNDDLPASVTALAIFTTQGVCGLNGVCSLGDVGVGESVTITLLGRVIDTQVDALSNSARVVASNPELTPEDNIASITTTVATLAELVIRKHSEPLVATPGSPLLYWIDVTNLGPSVARDVTISDTLPEGFVPLQTGSNCATEQLFVDPLTSTVVRCLWDVLPVGATVATQIAGFVRSEMTGTLTNSALVTSSTPLTHEIASSTTITTVLEPKVDLLLQKDATATAIAGKTLEYTITVLDQGPSDARSVTVTDTLPISVAFVAASEGCNSAAGEIICALGTLTTGQQTLITVTVLVAANVEPGSSLENVAIVTSSEIELNPVNNRDVADSSIIALADLQIDKSAPATVVAGERITYTIVLTNAGPSTAHFVDVKDSLPPGITLDSSEISRTGGGVSACGGLVCEMGDVAVGEVVTITLRGTVDSDPTVSGDVITNSATLFSVTADPVAANNQDSVTTSVTALASLHIEKRDLADPVAPDSPIVYAIVITNSGPSDAQNVLVSDLLPPGVSYQGSTGSCVESASGRLTCTIGRVKAGEMVSFLVVVQVDATVVSGSILRNNVLMSSSTPLTHSVLSDFEDTRIQQRFGAPADLAIEKRASSAAVFANDLVTYTLVITNYGPATATQVEVIDALPSGISLVQATVSSGNCIAGVLCKLGTLPFLGEPMSVTVVIVGQVAADVARGTVLTNTALVDSAQPDPDDTNNIDSAGVTVDTVADLEIIKSSTPLTVAAGSTIEYTLRVINHGPASAQQVVISDALPAGVTLIRADGCLFDGNHTLLCELGTQLRGEQREIHITVQSSADVTETIQNSALVGSTTPDPALDNNTSSVANPVISTPDLAVAKSVNRDRTFAGEVLTYTLTVLNNGPSTARDAMLTDYLPAGLALITAQPMPITLTSPLTWMIAQIDVGEMQNFVYSVRSETDLPVGTLLRNVAQISVANDPNSANNETQALSQIFGQGDVEVIKTPDRLIVEQGENVTYTIKVVNHGPSLAEDVDVKELLPPGLQLQQLQTSQGACVDSICQMGGLPVSNTVVITAVAKVDPSIAVGTVLTNTAIAFSDTSDPNAANNADEAAVIVGPVVNLSVSKVADQTQAQFNTEVTFTLVVTNAGPSMAPEVILTDTLPYGLTFRRSSLPCSADGKLVTCNLGDLVPGQVIQLELVTLFNEQGVNGNVSNHVAVLAENSYEPILEDNQAVAGVELIAVPTAINLVDFSAYVNEQHLIVAWETVFENGVAGYRILRSENNDPAQAIEISNGVIPTHGFAASYQFDDTTVEAGKIYYYWLEEIANDGTTTRHGPVLGAVFGNQIFLPLVVK